MSLVRNASGCSWQFDGDGFCDVGDADDDNDGVPDAQDSDPWIYTHFCPLDVPCHADLILRRGVHLLRRP